MSEQNSSEQAVDSEKNEVDEQAQESKEIGGPRGQEPARYGDWEKNGRCIDF